MATFSLYDDLTKVSDKGYGGTDLSKYLLQAAGNAVCAVKRNALIVYRLLSAASYIYNTINALIEKVDEDPIDKWDNYNLYTQAINPLEEFLIKLAVLAEGEAIQWLPDKGSLCDCLTLIGDWVDRRRALRDLLQKLLSTPGIKELELQSLSEADHISTGRYDDMMLLSALCSGLSTFKLTSEPKSRVAILQTKAGTIPSKIITETSDDTVVQTIRAFMLLYWVMMVMTDKTMPDALKRQLGSADVWAGPEMLVESLILHLGKPDDKAVKKAVDAFEKRLKNFPIAVEPPEVYIQQKKIYRHHQSGRKRRHASTPPNSATVVTQRYLEVSYRKTAVPPTSTTPMLVG